MNNYQIIFAYTITPCAYIQILGLNSMQIKYLNKTKIYKIYQNRAPFYQQYPTKINIYDLYLKYIHENILHYALYKILPSPDYIACVFKEDICRSVQTIYETANRTVTCGMVKCVTFHILPFLLVIFDVQYFRI